MASLRRLEAESVVAVAVLFGALEGPRRLYFDFAGIKDDRLLELTGV